MFNLKGIFGVVAGAAMAAVGIVLVLAFSELVPELGIHIGSKNLRVDWLIALVWSMLLLYPLTIGAQSRSEARVLAILWLARVGNCLVASLWYEAHYDFLDAFGFFNQSSGEFGEWRLGLGAGTGNILALCWFHQAVFPECYHVMKISFAAIGFIGLRCYFAAAREVFPERAKLSFLLLLGLIPSTIFWPSILGKDPVMFLAVGLYAYGACRWIARRDNAGWWIAALGILLGMFIRMWVGPVLAAPLALMAFREIPDIRRKIAYGTVTAVLFSLAVLLMLDQFGVDSLRGAIHAANEVSKGWNTGGSAQQVEEVNSVGELGIALPWWMFSLLFRPFPGEIPNLFGLLSGIENVAFLAMSCWAMYRWWMIRFSSAIWWWMLLTIMFFALVFCVPGYQNLGSAVRWRSPIIPFMVGVIAFAWIHGGQRRRYQPVDAQGQGGGSLPIHLNGTSRASIRP